MTALLVVLGVVVVVAAVIVRDQFRHPGAWGPPHTHDDGPPVVVVHLESPVCVRERPRAPLPRPAGVITPAGGWRPADRLSWPEVLEGEVVEQVPAVPNPRTAGRLPASTRRPSLDRG